MQEFESAQHLVDEVLDVLCEELLLGANDSAQVGLHQFTDKVDVSQNLTVILEKSQSVLVPQFMPTAQSHLPLFRNVDDIQKAKDVFVNKILHDNDLA